MVDDFNRVVIRLLHDVTKSANRLSNGIDDVQLAGALYLLDDPEGARQSHGGEGLAERPHLGAI